MNQTRLLLLTIIIIGAVLVAIGLYLALKTDTPKIVQPAQVQSTPTSADESKSTPNNTIVLQADQSGWRQIGSGSFSVKVMGTIDFGGITSDPKGVWRTGEGVKLALAPNLPFGAVIGKIEGDDKPFLVGSSYRFDSGNKTIYLAINDSIYHDNSGSYTVTIEK